MRKITELLETMDVEDLVKSYFRLGFSNKEILCLLVHQHGVIISKRTLQQLCRKLNLFRRKNQTDIEEIVSFVQSEMATSGRWLHLRAIEEDMLFLKRLWGWWSKKSTLKELNFGALDVSEYAIMPKRVRTPAEVLATSLFFFWIN